MRSTLLGFARDADDWLHEHVGRIRVLFLVANGIGLTCQAPLIEALRADPRFLVRTTARDPSFALAHTDDAQRACFRSVQVPHWRALLGKHHIVVHTDFSNTYFRRRSIHAYLHHGGAFGNGASDWNLQVATSPQFQVYLGASRHERSYLERFAPDAFSRGDRVFFATGSPAIDALLVHASDAARRSVLGRLGLPADRPTILVASTWTPGALYLDLGAAVVAEAARVEGVNVIATGHEYLWTRRTEGQAIQEELRRIAGAHPNVRFVQTSNAMPLLGAADVLVGDHSSLVPMYSALMRPICLYISPGHRFHDAEAGRRYLEVGRHLGVASEVAGLCRDAVRQRGEPLPGVERMRRYFTSHVGVSVDRIRRTFLEIGRVTSTRSPGWARALAACRDDCARATGETPGEDGTM